MVVEVIERSGRGRISDKSAVRVLRLSRVDVLAITSCVHIQWYVCTVCSGDDMLILVADGMLQHRV